MLEFAPDRARSRGCARSRSLPDERSAPGSRVPAPARPSAVPGLIERIEKLAVKHAAGTREQETAAAAWGAPLPLGVESAAGNERMESRVVSTVWRGGGA